MDEFGMIDGGVGTFGLAQVEHQNHTRCVNKQKRNCSTNGISPRRVQL
jgi:hypothetical protein